MRRHVRTLSRRRAYWRVALPCKLLLHYPHRHSTHAGNSDSSPSDAGQSHVRRVSRVAWQVACLLRTWLGDSKSDVLRRRLPEGFSFDRARYQLDWENWVLPQGLPGDPTVRGLIGISITTSDRSLGLALMDVIPVNAKFALGETYTFIFATQRVQPRLSREVP